MIWYALELLLTVIGLFAAFLLYRSLVNSPRFTRFIERTKGTETEPEDVVARLDVAEQAADQFTGEYESNLERQRRNLQNLKRRRSP